MSDTTGLRPISDEDVRKIAEVWYNRICIRLPHKRFEELREQVQDNMCRDIRIILDLARKYERV